MRFTIIGASMLAMTLAAPALAQTTAPQPAAERDHDHERDVAHGEVVVTAAVRTSERDVLQGTSVLSGEKLTRDLKPTIGETLAKLPGVSATSFGPSASRPILRGFQGDRIRLLTDGIGSIDVSNTSVDHAVIIDPLLADRIEVLRGPAALLFGSSAVGGVVNVIDKRIPRSVPTDGIRADAIATYGSAANERALSGAVDAALGSRFVVHADGSYLKSDDLRIGGYALSPAARAAALSQVGLPQSPAPGEDPIDFAANAAIKGKLPNTAAKTWTAGVGAAFVADNGGTIGVSYGHYDSLYGVPIRYATQVGQAQEAPRLDVVQNRVDLRAEVPTGGGFIDRLRLRVGHATYRHFELQEDNSVGTAFYNNGTEGRFEIVQANRGGWQGASGVQYFNRQFNVVGDEAFLPRNETDQTGIFTLQQYEAGPFRAEGGARYEWTDLAAKNVQNDLRFFTGQRNFAAFSASLGGSYALSPGVRLGVNLSRTSRAPTGEELFANGPHAGTQAYELGNPDFRVEKSWGIEGTVHVHADRLNFDGSVYYNRFSNYISENQVSPAVCVATAAPSGRTVDLPCFQYQQGDATYWGLEGDASYHLADMGAFRINADLIGDYVRANIKGSGPVPRIPPARLLGGLEAQGDTLSLRGEVEHVFEQNRIAPFETPTKDYTVVNATASWKPFGADSRTSLILSANNLFDVTARRHASFLKDFAPLTGRDFRATVRIGF